MELLNSRTLNNLAKSFAVECQARTRYEFIEYGARNEGYGALAEIIDKIVYNEFNHARMFYTFLQKASDREIKNVEISGGFPFKEKWDLVDNLRLAAEDEKREAELVYPEFARVAAEEGFKDIVTLYEQVISVEERHKLIFTELYTQMKDGSIYKKDKPVVWKCSHCGYEATSPEAWQKCPLCLAKQGEVLLHLENRVC